MQERFLPIDFLINLLLKVLLLKLLVFLLQKAKLIQLLNILRHKSRGRRHKRCFLPIDLRKVIRRRYDLLLLIHPIKVLQIICRIVLIDEQHLIGIPLRILVKPHALHLLLDLQLQVAPWPRVFNYSRHRGEP